MCTVMVSTLPLSTVMVSTLPMITAVISTFPMITVMISTFSMIMIMVSTTPYYIYYLAVLNEPVVQYCSSTVLCGLTEAYFSMKFSRKKGKGIQCKCCSPDSTRHKLVVGASGQLVCLGAIGQLWPGTGRHVVSRHHAHSM